MGGPSFRRAPGALVHAWLFWLTLGALCAYSVAGDSDQDGLRLPSQPLADDEPVESSPSSKYGRFHALLIGIDYREREGGYPGPLDSPRNDIDALAARLRQFGFEEPNILLNKHATRNAIEMAFQDYLQKDGAGRLVDPADSLLIYFAGHGVRSKSDEDLTYWLPYDAVENDPSSRIRGDDVIRWIGEIKARHVLLISDSCYSGGLKFRSDGESDEERRRQADHSLRKLLPRASVQVLSSGAADERVLDGSGSDDSRLSLFASKLDERLERVVNSKHPVRYLMACELFSTVKREVTQDLSSYQGPLLHYAPGKSGEFLFIAHGPPDDSPGERATERASERMEGWPYGWRIPGTLIPLGHKDFRGRESPTRIYSLKGEDRGAEMVLVEGDELFDPFLMDRYEVTNGRFLQFLRSRGREDDIRHWQHKPISDWESRPVVGVDLRTAREFALWAGKELPTAKEWMHAATWDPVSRASRRFAWGDRFEEGGFEHKRLIDPPVVTECPTIGRSFGLAAMGGGVREWCLDPDLDSGRFGVACGPTQVYSSVLARQDWSKPVSEHRIAVRANELRNNLGFRCIYRLQED